MSRHLCPIRGIDLLRVVLGARPRVHRSLCITELFREDPMARCGRGRDIGPIQAVNSLTREGPARDVER